MIIEELTRQEAVPTEALVIKVASRCNLDCSYCYEYRHGDESWRRQPALMSDGVAAQIGIRIAEHGSRWGVASFSLSLHGGEPLLLGAAKLERITSAIRRGAGDGVALHFGTQTNATLIDLEMASSLKALGITVGVSLDGDRLTNDRRRLDHRGRGSYSAACTGLQTLLEVAPKQFAGILAVIDIEADPICTFDSLAVFGPPQIDFLLPHATWDNLPSGRAHSSDTRYGDWLVTVFDAWFNGRSRHISIRTFDEIIEHLLGGPGRLETLGLEPVSLMTINVDGSIEGVDTLKAAYPGAQVLGLNVFDNSLDEALAHASMRMRQAGLRSLGTRCVDCSIVSTCGGGYLPHRHSRANAYRNPSVYCNDLAKLIRHIDVVLRRSVGGEP
jgi:uncharacterized protein